VRILTTTLCYPTPAHPEQGLFIRRRAEAVSDWLARQEAAGRTTPPMYVVAPRLWCPGLRVNEPVTAETGPLSVDRPRMPSVPGLSWALDGVAYAHTLLRTARRLIRGGHRFDLIDAHFVYPDGVGAWLAGRRLGLPVVVTVRGKIVSLSRKTLRRLQISAMLRRVDGCIAVSRSLADRVQRLAGTERHVDVIPNGIDPGVNHLVARDRAREILGWSPTARYVLSVGHLQRLKGFDRVLDVLPEVRGRLGDVRLVLAGSRRGELRYARRIRETIEQCNAECGDPCHSPAITFVGPVSPPDLNLMYNAADLMVLASRSEGWSNAISEALAAGTPVVATDVGGNREQICSSELGLIVPDGDPAALTNALTTALVRDWNRVLISAHGCARTWQQVAVEKCTVLHRVLNEYRARSGQTSVANHEEIASTSPSAAAWEVGT
jgi:glycosyltransferase involved in cell wall biosynthesis